MNKYVADVGESAYPLNVGEIMIDKARIQALEQLVKSLVEQLQDKQKSPKIWTPIKQEIIKYLMERKRVYDNEEKESDRYNAGLCYKYDTALQIILDLPTEG